MLRRPKLTTRLVKLREACHALAISHDSFSRHWQAVFTETRDKEERKKGVHRKVFEDELAKAVNAGGGTKAKNAVLMFRRTMGRL
ncbi:unnamed protein product [Gemmata massiliana]|uniref:Uncharacterized protein n=1 Tax=Gemmata massiliana TaxID=1210884 RepID=A0A6P2CU78_9BACT|nr:hypothetical protein [Gemmata massiliana]VTR92519.1 unnamed protein product [Gemmata massiliana]